MRMGEVRTNKAGKLVASVVCCALAAISVLLAVGAVVPAIGDVMAGDNTGVGAMFGYLVGALFFGGFGVVGLLAVRRDRRRLAVLSQRPAEPLPMTAGVVLPAGPGLPVRWLGAAPLMVLAMLLPTVGELTISAWSSVAFNDSFSLGDPQPTFWDEFWENAGYLGYVAALPLVVLVVFLVRRTFVSWPKACLWVSGWIVLPGLLLTSMFNPGGEILPNLAFGAGVVLLSWGLGRAALWLLSRPVARDLALSDMEIPYKVPGSRARLRVQRDRLLLDRLRAEEGNVHKEIRWADLQAVRLEHVTTPSSWIASGYTNIKVPAGPALRVLGRDDEWLLPVPEPLGEDLAAAVTLRANSK